MKYILSAAQALPCNPIVRHIALEVIAGADLIYFMLEMYRSREIDAHLPPRPPAAEWESLYAGGPRLLRAIADGDPSLFGMDGKEAVNTFVSLAQTSKLIRKHPNEFGEALKEVVQDKEAVATFVQLFQELTAFFETRTAEIAQELRDNTRYEVPEHRAALFDLPEPMFYLRVLLPCVIHYQRSPRDLLYEARRGDEKSIEGICRIDPWAQDLSVISDWLNAESGDERLAREKKYLLWKRKGLDHGQFSKARVKKAIGGFALSMVRNTGQYLDSKAMKFEDPEINVRLILNLFDAVEKERTGRSLAHDPDLNEIQIESLSKSMSEWADKWDELMPPRIRQN